MSELLPTVIQQAGERFGMLMGDPMGSNIAPLGEPFLAYVARKGLFSRVPSLVSLVIKQDPALDNGFFPDDWRYGVPYLQVP